MTKKVFVALLHYPMVNRRGEEVTTSVTNMDIHDISRSATTYGASKFFIVTPIEDQKGVVQRIMDHWQTESSREAHPDRHEALSKVRVVSDFEEVKKQILEETGELPEVVLTDARKLPGKSVTYNDYRSEIAAAEKTQPVLIVFGTGWGVSPTFYPEVHRILAPVYGREGEDGYNHLSVRAAAAIILDRLFGQ